MAAHGHQKPHHSFGTPDDYNTTTGAGHEKMRQINGSLYFRWTVMTKPAGLRKIQAFARMISALLPS